MTLLAQCQDLFEAMCQKCLSYSSEKIKLNFASRSGATRAWKQSGSLEWLMDALSFKKAGSCQGGVVYFLGLAVL